MTDNDHRQEAGEVLDAKALEAAKAEGRLMGVSDGKTTQVVRIIAAYLAARPQEHGSVAELVKRLRRGVPYWTPPGSDIDVPNVSLADQLMRSAAEALASSGEERDQRGGWKLVPVEPTPEMLSAVWSLRASSGGDGSKACYAAMLAASPAPSGVRDDAGSPLRGGRIDLGLIEAAACKINPGRSEDHIKSVALDALSIFRTLSKETQHD